jgi:ABC-2 type transport system ATP-binding protein
VLARFGSAAPAPPGAAAVRLRGGTEGLAGVVRALDAEDVAMSDFQLHAPTLDDVFLAKTGRKLDAGDEEGTGEHAEVVPA